MNKKVIQIVVIVIAFGVSGIVLYKGFFSNNTPAPTSAALLATSGSGKSIEKILPYGDSLDFSILKKLPLQFGILQLSVVNGSAEVGKAPQDLLQAPVVPGIAK